MSAKKQIEKEIREAYVFLREKNHIIASETLQFMLDASLEKLNAEEAISAFAFNTGRQIEKLILEYAGNTQERNNVLEAKIVEWFVRNGEEKMASYFGITTDRNGQTKN